MCYGMCSEWKDSCRVYVGKPYSLERGKEEMQQKLLRAESPNYLLNVLSSDFLIMLPYSPYYLFYSTQKLPIISILSQQWYINNLAELRLELSFMKGQILAQMANRNYGVFCLHKYLILNAEIQKEVLRFLDFITTTIC